MRLGGEINHGVDGVFREQAGHQHRVADIALHENVARVTGEICEVGRIAGIRQLVEVDEFGQERVAFSETLPDEIRANEAATAGDE